MESDRDLLVKAKGGDRRALDTLLRKHEPKVFRFGLRMCGDEEAAREVLQRTLLTAFEQLGTFREDAQLSTWLYSIARSFCSRHHRRTRSAPLHDVALDAPGGDQALPPAEDLDPESKVAQAEIAELLGAAIAALPDAYREVVVLRDVEGLSAEEASAVIGIGVPALKSRLHRGRQMLKAHLAALLREEGRSVGGVQACGGLAKELEGLADQELDQNACAAIEEHVRGCRPCAATLGKLQETAALCSRLPKGEVPEPVQRAVRSALLDALGGG
ncbi:sigma-70 family RNA polymerase sigma factor [Vulgatibacter sp.]|uniref:sigma-70 family RNA polymerase sigma factor n=1 Tax=Vulgatibacter sp. TaxID=1971226 RepID=UPI0035691415